jgi:hypothetical protein
MYTNKTVCYPFPIRPALPALAPNKNGLTEVKPLMVLLCRLSSLRLAENVGAKFFSPHRIAAFLSKPAHEGAIEFRLCGEGFAEVADRRFAALGKGRLLLWG